MGHISINGSFKKFSPITQSAQGCRKRGAWGARLTSCEVEIANTKSGFSKPQTWRTLPPI